MGASLEDRETANPPLDVLVQGVNFFRHLLGQSLDRLTLRVVDEMARCAKLPLQPLPHGEHEAVVGNEECVTLADRKIDELLFLIGSSRTFKRSAWDGRTQVSEDMP